MGIKASFLVQMSPDTLTNKFMRCADLFREGEGVVINRYMTVTWKDGEKVGKKRIEQTKENIKKALEKMGYDCFSVQHIGERQKSSLTCKPEKKYCRSKISKET